MSAIRRNSHKKIASILASSVLIREYNCDDMGDTNRPVEPARVLRIGKEIGFDRIYTDGATTRFCVHRNWQFTAYDTVESARYALTPQAFAKYFPE